MEVEHSETKWKLWEGLSSHDNLARPFLGVPLRLLPTGPSSCNEQNLQRSQQ